jgi:parallel beta-helix repeat protein
MREHFPWLVAVLLLVGVLALASPTRQARPESVAIVVPDDYLTIHEAINGAADGDTVFVKNGTYYEHVVVNKTVNLVGEESSATIVDGNGTGRVIDIVSDNVNLTGFTVQRSGSIMFPDSDAAISITGVNGCGISSNIVVDNGCFGIHLLNSNQCTISGNTFTRNTWYAIDLTTSSNNTVSTNIMLSNPNIGIGMHTSSQNNLIQGNMITNSTYGIDVARSSFNTISGNRLANNSETGIWIQDYATNNAVYGNNVTSGRYTIRIDSQASSNALSGNILTDGHTGIQISNARYTEIYNNTIAHHYAGEWDAGIRLDWAGDSRIRSNVITDNWRGILLYTSSPNVVIYRNNITYNDFGVCVASGGSNYLNVSDNQVMHNRGYGIGLTGFSSGSHYATIARNVIADNSDGIALGQYSNYHTIRKNTITQNGYGFYIEYSTQNTVWHNIIVNNTQPVHLAMGSANTWDGGYPAGGNYWGDYTDADSYKGEHQNETGGDGVWDLPYIIDVDNYDRYPLTKPLGGPAGDVDGDRDVDIFDIVRMAIVYGVEYPDPRYDRLCDVDLDGDINIFDIVAAADHYGESW